MENSKETGIGTESAAVNKATLNTGDTMALKDLLEKRLNDCGWRKEIEQLIRNTLEERGVANITHDQLAAMIVPNPGSCFGARCRTQGNAVACARGSAVSAACSWQEMMGS
ncbi:enhancer of yellow 2b transcription factor isoform X1 [Drosophila montana]|uniref:enhancer of yellow 2b transcription factor isoform X1 n=1 Tax=Drosophila montana TaxID=40370 RepID=UPI00313ACE70